MEADLEYIFVEMDFAPSERRAIRDRLQWPTFPIVLVRSADGDKVLGGYEQLKEYMRVP
jgi:glutaredoxin-related protein